MNFLSIAYLLFLPAVFAVHWAVPARFRWATVLVASFGFYACRAAGVVLHVPIVGDATTEEERGAERARRRC